MSHLSYLCISISPCHVSNFCLEKINRLVSFLMNVLVFDLTKNLDVKVVDNKVSLFPFLKREHQLRFLVIPIFFSVFQSSIMTNFTMYWHGNLENYICYFERIFLYSLKITFVQLKDYWTWKPKTSLVGLKTLSKHFATFDDFTILMLAL